MKERQGNKGVGEKAKKRDKIGKEAGEVTGNKGN